MAVTFDEATLKRTYARAQAIADEWQLEVPTRMHTSALASDGDPQWDASFAKWLFRGTARHTDQNGTERLRLTKALRKVRRLAPRSYEVAYRLLALGDTVPGTTRWLNERAARNSIPLPTGKTQWYTPKDTVALLIAAVDLVTELR